MPSFGRPAAMKQLCRNALASPAFCEVAPSWESRSDGQQKPRTSVRGNGEKRTQSPEGTTHLSRQKACRPFGTLERILFVNSTMDLRPWLLHVMPSAFRWATASLALRVSVVCLTYGPFMLCQDMRWMMTLDSPWWRR